MDSNLHAEYTSISTTISLSTSTWINPTVAELSESRESALLFEGLDTLHKAVLKGWLTFIQSEKM
jgi:hypothetical protein